MNIFISGHLDLTEEEFKEHYIPLIQKHIDANDTFLIGDAKGCDLMAQNYIASKIKNSGHNRVCIYHMHGKPRYNPHKFPTENGFKSDEGRDSAMTDDSDTDLAWVRSGREKSDTAKNLTRRNIKE